MLIELLLETLVLLNMSGIIHRHLVKFLIDPTQPYAVICLFNHLESVID
jgi:hypothetical protein